MNFVKLFTVLLFLSLLASCGGEDECAASKWAGTWNGELTCEDGTTESAEIVIREIDENTIGVSVDGEEMPIPLSGCSFIAEETEDTIFGVITLKVEATLDGDKMNYVIGTNVAGISISCDAVFTRG